MACNFLIDRQLHITTWGREIAEFTGKSSTAALGKKYYDVFPMLVSGNADAISAVFEKKDILDLRGYPFNGLFGQFKADINVKPVMTDDTITAVEVNITPGPPCSVSKQLIDSQRLIDIGKMASTLAHGVRNPLNAIKGAVVYLREKYANESTLIEFTEIMEAEISRLDNFISRFLSTSISEAEFTEIDINALIGRIQVFMVFQTRSSNIRFNCECGDVPLIKGNAFHLEQAILNVVNNAIEAMPSSGQLTVKTRVEAQSGSSFVVVEISDTGHGILENRNDRSRGKEKGKGFGLFITREILKCYGGHLEIKSRKGKGTDVRLYFPVRARE